MILSVCFCVVHICKNITILYGTPTEAHGRDVDDSHVTEAVVSEERVRSVGEHLADLAPHIRVLRRRLITTIISIGGEQRLLAVGDELAHRRAHRLGALERVVHLSDTG